MPNDTYSRAYRARLSNRLIGPYAVSVGELSVETGVSAATLYRWKQKAEGAPFVAAKKRKKEPKPGSKRSWAAAEKLRILSEASSLSEDELGAYLRKEGVHPDQLQAWRDALEEKPPCEEHLRQAPDS